MSNLFEEAVQIWMQDSLDDVDCSSSTRSFRNKRFGEITEVLGEEAIHQAVAEAEARISQVTHLASGSVR